MIDKKKIDILSIFDEPIVYKELKLYPIMVKDYMKFYSCIDCLQVRKNNSADINIIKMSYLEFILSHIKKDSVEFNKEENNEAIFHKFIVLMVLVFKLNEETVLQDGTFKIGTNSIMINEIKINSTMFDDIRNIIFQQNYVIFDDNLSIDMQMLIQKHESMEANSDVDLEDSILDVALASNMSMKDIFNLTLRKFNKLRKKIAKKINYDTYASISAQNGHTMEIWTGHESNDPDYSKYFGTTLEKGKKRL